ncbi:hypothetical protein HOLleu_11495 [Holothuria leucospilota]|uniref:Uncharacterized protein n=1 Tax=Holothuria leucospilota TaxID=206669 RepID=A0A9Q1CEZ8_HOLLE|nr:hypothetical protein HOLleu_11495 [Holothuria leucospilota]
MESSRKFNFNAAFLELSRRKNCLRGLTTLLRNIDTSPSLVVIRSWNQFLRCSTLQVYYRTIVDVHALPTLGPDQNTIK